MLVRGIFVHVPIYITARRIRKGEEVLVYYGDKYERNYTPGMPPEITSRPSDELVTEKFKDFCASQGLNDVQVTIHLG